MELQALHSKQHRCAAGNRFMLLRLQVLLRLLLLWWRLQWRLRWPPTQLFQLLLLLL
jgi:hypothetical protein